VNGVGAAANGGAGRGLYCFFAAQGFTAFAAQGFTAFAAHGFTAFAAHGFTAFAAHGFTAFAAHGLTALAAHGLHPEARMISPPRDWAAGNAAEALRLWQSPSADAGKAMAIPKAAMAGAAVENKSCFFVDFISIPPCRARVGGGCD
jgi:hypothetical protein